MINNISNSPSFGARWTEVRKVLQDLPHNHKLFDEVFYTVNRKPATKDVLLKRLDLAAQKAKEINPDFEIIFNTRPFKDSFFNLFAVWAERNSEKLQSSKRAKEMYPFRRSILVPMSGKRGGQALLTYEKDSIALVRTFLGQKREMLSLVLKKAGLEDPHKISYGIPCGFFSSIESFLAIGLRDLQ